MSNTNIDSEQINQAAGEPVLDARRHGRSWMRRAVYAGIVVGLTATVLVMSNEHVAEPPDLTDPATKLRAARVISSFENSTTDLQYGYVENLDDGRGITAGRAGFTTGTSDLLEVVERYTREKPQNELAPFMSVLQKVNGTDSTEGLNGLPAAWKHAAADPAFRKAQDDVETELYFNPAMKWAKQANVHSAVGELILWDTIIQHGGGDDIDGLPAIVHETEQKNPPKQTSEKAWLSAFLQIRKQHLEHAADPATRQEWLQSADRVNALSSFITSHDLSLKPPLRWNVYGDSYSLDK